MAFLPYRRQGGQHLHLTVVALQQHLGDACRASEVAIDLEGRVGAEQIGISAGTMGAVVLDGRPQQLLKEEIGMVAVT